MAEQQPIFIRVRGELINFEQPLVMGILNITPDSFYAGSRKETEKDIAERCTEIIAEGGRIIDIGAYSSRPHAVHISEEEEMKRLRMGLSIIKKENPQAILSVDTFRANVARMCVEDYGVDIINDISGGLLDTQMASTVGKLGVPYILMHMKGTPQTMQDNITYEHLVPEVMTYFSRRIEELRAEGVKDIIVDPGFGFAKTLAHNYELMKHLEDFHLFNAPLLVGVSRKSMIYHLLGGTPTEALNGTTILNTIALQKGAHILRVHDVKEAVEAIRIVEAVKNGITK